DGEYKSGVTIDLPTFLKKVRETKKLPQSSAPSPNDFYEAYKKVEPDKPILMLSMTKGLSSTYEHAVLGKQMLLEEQPHRTIEVINNNTASCVMAQLIQQTKKKKDAGYTFDELVPHLHERVEQTATFFVLKTLENLVLRGQLHRVTGATAITLR